MFVRVGVRVAEDVEEDVFERDGGAVDGDEVHHADAGGEEGGVLFDGAEGLVREGVADGPGYEVVL